MSWQSIQRHDEEREKILKGRGRYELEVLCTFAFTDYIIETYKPKCILADWHAFWFIGFHFNITSFE